MQDFYQWIDNLNPFILLGSAFMMLVVGHLLTKGGYTK